MSVIRKDSGKGGEGKKREEGIKEGKEEELERRLSQRFHPLLCSHFHSKWSKPS